MYELVTMVTSDFRRLLQAEQIDVSYFAAGIVAHLASDGEQSWLIAGTDRADILNELVTSQSACDLENVL